MGLELTFYRLRRPETGVLYKVISENLETFIARSRMVNHRGIPDYVEQEFRSFLECGVLAYGFIRVKCSDCGKEKLVPFSCKKRGFCPCCCGKRMNETAIHLTDNMIPRVSVRQFVVTFPLPLRFWMAANPKLQAKILEIAIRAINGYYRKKLKNKYGIKDLKTGAVTLIQRSGSALNLNIHFHILFIDGGFEISDNKRVFYRAPDPDDKEVNELIKKISLRVIKYLRKKGYLSQDGYSEELQYEHPALTRIMAASVKNVIAMGPRASKFVRRLIAPGWGYEDDVPEKKGRRCFSVNSFSLHAATLIKSHERTRLENLCRYVLRPPVAQERLRLRENGDVSLKLKKAWDDGTTHVVFSPMELMEKLAALVPPPRIHMIRFHGILAPHAKNRSEVARSRKEIKEEARKNIDPDSKSDIAEIKDYKMTWARMLKRIFNIDVEVCSHCGGKTKIIGPVLERSAIRKILIHIGADPDPPEISPTRYEQYVCGF